MNLEELRKFLERNKIFFDTIVAVSLSIMAIIVAIGAFSVTSRQSEFGIKTNSIFLIYYNIKE
jgi:hypothetical protein